MKIKYYEENNLKFISLDNGMLKLTLCNLGASIFSIHYLNNLMTMTNENIEDFKLPNIYHGKSIGRTCNRLAGNNIFINGEKFVIKNNEGINTLHGGKDGFSTKIFEYTVSEGKNCSKVEFSYISPDGESGFPGRINLRITYIIFEKTNKFKIKFSAKTTKSTYCNLTNHTYFTLGEKTLDNLLLKVNASKYIKCGIDDLIPLSEKNVTKNLDFRKYKRITKDIDKLRYGKQNGYDHCFVCNKDLILYLKSEKFILKIESNFDCCQIYTDNWPNDSIKWIYLPGGSNRSIAIEPQDNILYRKLLNPGEKYSRVISYQFK